MKIKTLFNNRRVRSGYALLIVMVMCAVSIMILAEAMNRTSTIGKLNDRNNQYTLCANAAEAATEKVAAKMAYDYETLGAVEVSSNLNAYRSYYPSSADDSFWSQFRFSDAMGNTNKTYVAFLTNYTGLLPTQYTNYFAVEAPVYRIISNVTLTNSNYSVTGTAQLDVLLAAVPLDTFAIFYNGLLEFSGCADMIINGRVHSNGAIDVGTSASLLFNSPVTTSSTLSYPKNNGTTFSKMEGTTFHGSPQYTTNAQREAVAFSMTNTHEVLDIPPAGEDVMSQVGSQRLYNQAPIVLIVTNSPVVSSDPEVIVTYQQSINGSLPGADPSPTIMTLTDATPSVLSSNLPFLTLTNTFDDQREEKNTVLAQIDVGQYSSWLSTNSTVSTMTAAGTQPTILYVADQRSHTSSQFPAVRLTDAAQLPSNNSEGFSVATPDPLYVQGNYNIQINNDSSHQSINTSNTTYTVPSALMSDALTILSDNWNDSQSTKNYDNYSADDTTVNAAILTGAMPSTGTSYYTFSGGVQNLVRLLEDWDPSNRGRDNQQDLTINTSIINLFQSEIATNQFRDPGGFNLNNNPYYDPPNRNWSFDLNFLDPNKQPPGVPASVMPIRFNWAIPPPGVTNYNP